MELPKNYDPSLFEAEIYATWEKKGYFKAQGDKAPEKPSFCIVMPPPNITGQLHMGHALDNTIQDTITRYKRMAGYDALWLPGTDHASIATELKVVEKLRSEGISKEQIGREKFLEHAFAWKDEYGGRIVKQLRRLGSSCDWSREAFTMDKNCSKAVRAVFKRLYDKGLIYKGKKIVNWCPSCRTALSDAEVEYDEKDGFLWHIRYPLTDGTGYLTVATTRPETMLGDTAVAVNPQDEKYKSIVGKTLTLPLVNKEIPVIADSYVEIGFGTGAVKITPAHDPNDFEVGLRHDLEVIDVMTDSALMNENAGKYEGLTSLECRKQIVNDLDEQGYLVKTEPYKHNVGSCYRCGTTAEPRVSEQWFVKMTPLAKPAIRAVRQRKTVFVPDRFSKIYYNWMENIRDWCISRSLWWGHRLPVYYCAACGEVHVTDKEAAPTKCTKCGGTAFTQEEAVLDTWFSSALWPFSTLGYPNMQSKDLSKFYPTDVLVTAYDIIFFWVARMIFSGIENMGQVPFAQVLIHGIVRDSQGRKMSKSLGNGIDPLILIDKFGADALRLSLITGIAPGTDIRFSEDKIEPQRNFLNKLWNASRFVMMNLEGKSIKDVSELTKITSAGKWILKKTDSCVRAVTRNLEKYELGLALARIYDFIWGDYCDWYIELTKASLQSGDNEEVTEAASVLYYVLKTALKLLHPFAPFVTEKIYSELNTGDKTIMLSEFPVKNRRFSKYPDAKRFETIKEIIKSIRNLRLETGVAPSQKVTLNILTPHENYVKRNEHYIKKLANVAEIKFITGKDDIIEKTANIVLLEAELFIPLGELIDFEKERARLTKEFEKLQIEIKRGEGMLSNIGFVNKAPVTLIDAEKQKLEENKIKSEKIKLRIAEL